MGQPCRLIFRAHSRPSRELEGHHGHSRHTEGNTMHTLDASATTPDHHPWSWACRSPHTATASLPWHTLICTPISFRLFLMSKLSPCTQFCADSPESLLRTHIPPLNPRSLNPSMLDVPRASETYHAVTPFTTSYHLSATQAKGWEPFFSSSSFAQGHWITNQVMQCFCHSSLLNLPLHCFHLC